VLLPLIWLSPPSGLGLREVAMDTVHGAMPERRIINDGDFVVADRKIEFECHISAAVSGRVQ
jgi:hypothetical protein